MFSKATQENAEKLSNEMFKVADDLTDEELDCYIFQLSSLTIAIMRGAKGNQFVKNFLTAALNDENPPKIVRQKLH